MLMSRISKKRVVGNTYPPFVQKNQIEWNSSIFDCGSTQPFFGNYSVISKLGKVSPAQSVPKSITLPSYFESSVPIESPKSPEIKTKWQIIQMKYACGIARTILNLVSKHISVGRTTEEIDSLAHKTILKYNSFPSPLNYHGFPKSVCTSVNNVACHGIPDDRPLHDGDIISIDLTVFHNGFHGDCCDTFCVGDVDEVGKHLVFAARKCCDRAINICGPDVPFSHIGEVVESVASKEGVCVVPAFTGHGIGQYFHGPPDIYHCHNTYPGIMKPGMTFTIEPVIAQGNEDVVVLEDGWTAVMADNGRAAQFEHTILITENGNEILTKCSEPS